MNLNFIYLGGGFQYAYQLSLKSARRTQRFDDIVVWHTEDPGDVKAAKRKLPDVRLLSVQRTKDAWVQMANLKDYYAYWLLAEHGGAVVDLDTLFLKDVSGLLGDWDLVVPFDAPDASIAFPYGSSMFIGKAGAPVCKDLLKTAQRILSEPWEIRWGATGPVLVTQVARDYPDKVHGAEFGFLGGVGGQEAKMLYEEDEAARLPRECYILHCFAFAWKQSWAKITPEWVMASKSLYARLARQVCGIGGDEVKRVNASDEAWTKRGKHYRPMFEWLSTHECRNIMEIGTHNGNNAVEMVKAAARRVPEAEIAYYGFDLFEDLTPDLVKAEFSYPSPGSAADIQKSIETRTAARIWLTKGDTKATLPAADLRGAGMDLIYIDGGHSVETIRSDWRNVQRFVHGSTAIFLDDYFPGNDSLGCKFLVPEVKGYDVTLHPQVDSYRQPDGSELKIQLMQALPAQNPTLDEGELEINDERWQAAQRAESQFWAYDKNVSYGQVKEQAYVPFLGLDKLRKGPYFDLGGRSVLDIGGGPVSLLLRCVNFSKGVVLDPCEFDPWIYERYRKNNIEVVRQKAEEYQPGQRFDEAWIYNVLQHVQSPEAVVAMARRTARKVRVFEWRETPIDVGHPHSFAAEELDRLFGQKGQARSVAKGDMLCELIHNTEEKIWWGVFDYGPAASLPASGASGRFRFHIPAYVHLPVSKEYMGCAFTQKVVKLCQMLVSLGHEVYLYGAEGSDAPCTEFIQTHTLAEIRRTWGDEGGEGIGYDWRQGQFRHDFNTERTPLTLRFYEQCVEAINRRKRSDDFLLLMQGQYHKPIADGVGLWLTCEPGIGYRGSYARFRAFESAYLQNFTYGSEHPRESINGHYYDRVVPNYFDPADFPFRAEKEDWFLYIGRMITRKGVWTAIKTTAAIGAKLVLAGQADPEIDVAKLPPHCEFVGFADPRQRAELMGRARAVFVPTLYLEAFGGTNVEAQLCGTPAITTNFGCFAETVQDNATGFRCNTLDDFVWAARRAGDLDPQAIREHAMRYAMDNVRWEFQRWFDDLYTLYESAVDVSKAGWHRIRDMEPEWRAHGLHT